MVVHADPQFFPSVSVNGQNAKLKGTATVHIVFTATAKNSKNKVDTHLNSDQA